MGLKETASVCIQYCFVRKVNIPVVVTGTFLSNFFFDEKRFFTDGVYGTNGKDLANAVFQKAVVAGDILEVTIQLNGQGLVVEQFIYKKLGEKKGSHVFDLKFEDQLVLESENILGWKKLQLI